jgi:hypothetical protein
VPEILCPKCAVSVSPTGAETTPCPVCRFEIPRQYARDYQFAPPSWVIAIGYPDHGKSSLIRGLMMMLRSGGVTLRYGMNITPCGNATLQKIKEMTDRDARHEPEPKTKGHDVYLLSAQGLGGSAPRTLVLHDVQGQLFEQLGGPQALAVLRHVRTVWMIVSPKDLERDQQGQGNQRMDELFHTYTEALEGLGVSPAGRTVVVVYTKADEYDDFPRDAERYRRDCQFRVAAEADVRSVVPAPDFSFSSYLDELTPISHALQDWTKTLPGGPAFLMNARREDRKVHLRFCLTSATGRSINPQTNRFDRLSRFRIFDPLFLTLAEDRPAAAPVGPRVALVLDASADGSPAFAEGLPERLAAVLQRSGQVVTYYLGSTAPVAEQGAPRDRPVVVLPRLIGPILERESPGTRFLIASAGQVIDLYDFYTSEWRSRIAFLGVGGYREAVWPRAVQAPDGARIEDVLSPYFSGQSA